MLRKLVVVALVLGVMGSASAGMLPMPVGHVAMKLNDWTSLYDANGQPLDQFGVPSLDIGLYTQPGSHEWVGKELRGIFWASDYGLETPKHQGDYNVVWNDGDGGLQLTGTITGMRVAAIEITGSSFDPTRRHMDIIYTPIAPTATDEDGPPIYPAGSGGRITLKASPDSGTSDFTADPNVVSANNIGADEWIVPGGYDGDAPKRLEYPTAMVRDILLNDRVAGNAEWLVSDSVLVPQFTYEDMPIVMFGSLDFTQWASGQWGATGKAELWVNSVRDGLPAPFGVDSAALLYTRLTNGMVVEDHFGPGKDAWMLTNLQWGYDEAGNPLSEKGWMFRSQDPMRFVTVPEPTTMALVGLGLLGLVRRRRNKA